jgi:hypothetical protein
MMLTLTAWMLSALPVTRSSSAPTPFAGDPEIIGFSGQRTLLSPLI